MPAALVHNAYGKSQVRLTKVQRRPDRHDLIDWSIDVRLEGDFAAAFTDGDNRHVVATDTMKNIVYALARDHDLAAPETFGLILGTGNKDTLIRRAEALAAGHPVMRSLVAKLAEVRRHVASQIAAIDRAGRSAGVEAIESSTVASLAADQFEALLLREPQLALATLKHVAAEVRRLLDNRALRVRLGAQARARVLEEFRLDHAIARYLALYRDLGQDRAAA